MGRNRIILLAIAIAALVVCAFTVIKLLYQIIKNKKDDTVSKQKVSKKTNNLMWVYHLYKNTPFLKRYFVKIRSKVSLMDIRSTS